MAGQREGEMAGQRENETAGKRDRKKVIRRHTDLEVYKRAFDAAMRIFDLTKSFPKEETYSLIDQVRRSSRSICAGISEGWRKRRYKLLFINKLVDADGEAAETQTWIQFAVKCGYLKRDTAADLYREYDDIIGMLVKMYTQPDQWIL